MIETLIVCQETDLLAEYPATGVRIQMKVRVSALGKIDFRIHFVIKTTL